MVSATPDTPYDAVEVAAPEPQENAKFGFFISVLGDVNGDGDDDIAVGTDAQDVGTDCTAAVPLDCNQNQGKACVFSGGEEGELLYALDNPEPQPDARFGSRIGRAGDVTGDEIPDVIVGASNNDVPANCGQEASLANGFRVNQGQAFIFNGANGALVRTLDMPVDDEYVDPLGVCTLSCGSVGLAVQGPGDTDGDGVVDQLVDAGSYSFYTGTGTPCGAPEPNGCNEGPAACTSSVGRPVRSSSPSTTPSLKRARCVRVPGGGAAGARRRER